MNNKMNSQPLEKFKYTIKKMTRRLSILNKHFLLKIFNYFLSLKNRLNKDKILNMILLLIL